MSVAEPNLLIAKLLRHPHNHRLLEFDIVLARGWTTSVVRCRFLIFPPGEVWHFSDLTRCPTCVRNAHQSGRPSTTLNLWVHALASLMTSSSGRSTTPRDVSAGLGALWNTGCPPSRAW